MGEYAPAEAPSSAEPASVRRAVEEAFRSCAEAVLAGYATRLRRVEVLTNAIRLEGAASRGDVHSAVYRVSAPLPRLRENQVYFPPFYSFWDVVTRYSAEMQVRCHSPEASRRLIDAVAALRTLPAARAAQSADFEKNLAEYRAKKGEAPPEEARRLKSQAEAAVGLRRFEDALSLYDRAADLAPWWPDAWFHRALILAELGRFEEAIEAMQKHLALEPAPQDVRAAKDKIYSWEGK